MSDYVKKPCKHCPYRHDVKPFLTAERGEELAYHAQNPYNSFPCHKTMDEDEDGETFQGEATQECAGFLTLQKAELGETFYDEDGFEPSYDVVYSESHDMALAYEEAAEH